MGMIWKAVALAGACGIAMCGAARADVVYDFSGTAPGQISPLVVSLDLTDAQVASGAFSLFAQGNGGARLGYAPLLTGDVGGFTSLRFGGDTVTSSYVYGYLPTMNLAFTQAGDLSSVNVDWQGNSTNVVLSGTGALTTATYTDDNGAVCNGASASRSCTVSGSWTHTTFPSPVPEPASLVILGAGVIGLAAARRRYISSLA